MSRALQPIISAKQAEIRRAKQRLAPALLRQLCQEQTAPRGFRQQIEIASSPRVIAEVKRASPSRGVLRKNDPVVQWNPAHLACAYEQGGAAALSVLTDIHFFWGHPDAIMAIKEVCALPILRKDFIIDVYQVDESRWLGADAILLIARILTPQQLRMFSARAAELGMDVLVEVHNEEELNAACSIPHAMIGINNRDLDTLQIDVALSSLLAKKIDARTRCVVAESGIDNAQTMAQLMYENVNTFLIGEYLACHQNPSQALQQLRNDTQCSISG